jgi:hypothetical protein
MPFLLINSMGGGSLRTRALNTLARPALADRGMGVAGHAGSHSGHAILALVWILIGGGAPVEAGMVLSTAARAELIHSRFLENRRASLPKQRNPYKAPAQARVVEENPAPWEAKRNSWHHQINATVFWVGELPTPRNPTPNTASSWDQHWVRSFGGYDDPQRRKGFAPAGFSPKLNPFYFALPYNDLGKDGRHRPEAAEIIPWFWSAYQGASISVCEDRWVAIHHRGQICFAQWKDVGPFRTDDWQYVFKGQKPQPNPNGNAGIDVSPSVRDYLGFSGSGKVDWCFVDDHEVRDGPWAPWVAFPPPGS